MSNYVVEREQGEVLIRDIGLTTPSVRLDPYTAVEVALKLVERAPDAMGWLIREADSRASVARVAAENQRANQGDMREALKRIAQLLAAVHSVRAKSAEEP